MEFRKSCGFYSFRIFPLLNKQAIAEESTIPEHCLKLERWQGPPHINKVKQYEIVLSCKVSLVTV